MPNRPTCLLCLSLVLASCAAGPDAYSPPRQRRTLDRGTLTPRLLEMSDDAVGVAIVKDVARGPGQQWRWTADRPTLRVPLIDIDTLMYRIDFAVADATFSTTGPVTVTFLVNEQVLGRLHCDKPGPRHWEAPVPKELLKAESENTIGAAVDKVWVSPQDGARLGLILSSIGLVPQQ